ncbi:MAG: signal peptidase II [Clostridia bacterium]|nr:signal peptidase II [Clostridia bacterium]
MKKKMISYILALIVAGGIISIDQYTKALAVERLADSGNAQPFIKGILEFSLIKNTGGAWGILHDNTWILISVTLVVTVVIVALLLKYGPGNKLVFWAATFVLGGGIGNMIDRIFKNGAVVDFLHFEFWKTFPTFNIADCAIVVGAALMVLYFMLDSIKEYKKRKIVKKDDNEDN